MRRFFRILCFFLLCALPAGLLVLPIAATDGGLPVTSAASAILIDADSGRVIGQKDADTRRPPASTTKIMTALVALRALPLETEITVDAGAVGIEGSSVYLYPGEVLTLGDLLYALLLESANDAAAAIAIAVSGSIDAFAVRMNETTAELGLTDTQFTNPHGLPDEAHYTTARELATITRAALAIPAFGEMVSTYRHTIPLRGDEGARLLLNHNKLLRLYDGAIGVKTGFTKRSGRCLVSAAERDGVRLIAVTLDAPDDWRDHRTMLDYGFAQSRHVALGEAGTLTYTVPVAGGQSEAVTVANTLPLAVTLPIDAPEPTLTVELPRMLMAPVAEHTVVGRLIWRSGDDVVGESPLVTAYAVEAKVDTRPWYVRLFARLFG